MTAESPIGIQRKNITLPETAESDDRVARRTKSAPRSTFLDLRLDGANPGRDPISQKRNTFLPKTPRIS